MDKSLMLRRMARISASGGLRKLDELLEDKKSFDETETEDTDWLNSSELSLWLGTMQTAAAPLLLLI